MSLRRNLPTNRDDESDRSSSLENDKTPTYNSNITSTTPPTHNLSGRDSLPVRLPDETKPPLTDTLDLNLNYSKRPSGKLPILLIGDSENFYQYTTGYMPRTELFPQRHQLHLVILS